MLESVCVCVCVSLCVFNLHFLSQVQTKSTTNVAMPLNRQRGRSGRGSEKSIKKKKRKRNLHEEEKESKQLMIMESRIIAEDPIGDDPELLLNQMIQEQLEPTMVHKSFSEDDADDENEVVTEAHQKVEQFVRAPKLVQFGRENKLELAAKAVFSASTVLDGGQRAIWSAWMVEQMRKSLDYVDKACQIGLTPPDTFLGGECAEASDVAQPNVRNVPWMRLRQALKRQLDLVPDSWIRNVGEPGSWLAPYNSNIGTVSIVMPVGANRFRPGGARPLQAGRTRASPV